MQNLVHFSQAASEKLQELFQTERDDALKVRLFVVGGSCSGLQYAFQMDNTVVDDDTVLIHEVNHNGQIYSIPLIADFISVQYLKGAIVDYRIPEGEAEGRFSIHNSSIQIGCAGCGGGMGGGY